MRSALFALTASALLVATTAHASGDAPSAQQTQTESNDGTTFGLGAGVGFVATPSAPYSGEAATIGRALGSQVQESATGRFTPVLTQSLWFGRPSGNASVFGLVLTERWWSMSVDATSSSAQSASHRIDRSVFVVDAQVMASIRADEGVRLLLGLGPALYRVTMEESGWLGDGKSADFRPGLRASIGPRIAIGSGFDIAFDASLEVFSVPRRSAVLKDGGEAWTGMLGVRLEGLL